MALFRGGPRSNITQVVSPMYQGIIQAEKQKGQAVREAMGAFGKAIDPKTIGMRKFKEEFANADWTNPETYFSASKFLSEFDPTAAMDMSNRGMQLRAATAPKRDMQIVEEYDPKTGQMVQKVVNLATVAEGTIFGAAKAPESTIGAIKVADFTPESVDAYAASGQYSDLVPVGGTDTVFGKVTPKDYTTESIKAFQAGGATDYSLLVPRNPAPDPDVYSIEKVEMNGKKFTVAINRTNPADRVIIGTGESGSNLTAAQQNFAAYNSAYEDLEKKLNSKEITQQQFNDRHAALEKVFLGKGESASEVAFAGASVKEVLKISSELDSSKSSAQQNLSRIGQSLKLLDEGVYTGFGGEVIADINNLLVSLGLQEQDAAAGAEQFRVNAMAEIMSWIEGTKGAISDAEMRQFKAASSGLSRTEAGNRLILNTAKQVADWEIKKATDVNDWIIENTKEGTPPSIFETRQYITEWEQENRLSLPSTKIEEAINSDPFATTATAPAAKVQQEPVVDPTEAWMSDSKSIVGTGAYNRVLVELPEEDRGVFEFFVTEMNIDPSLWEYYSDEGLELVREQYKRSKK